MARYNIIIILKPRPNPTLNPNPTQAPPKKIELWLSYAKLVQSFSHKQHSYGESIYSIKEIDQFSTGSGERAKNSKIKTLEKRKIGEHSIYWIRQEGLKVQNIQIRAEFGHNINL